MLHPDSDHEYDEEIKRSLTSTSSLVESESEEGHDRRHGHVFDSDETTVNDAVTNPNTTASVVTENNDTADGHIFDGIVSRGIGNITLESNQYNVGEGNLRDNTSDLSADDTLHSTATEGDFTETVVGRNASNICQSPTQERPHSYNTIDQHDNRPDEEHGDDQVINPSIYHIMERYLADLVKPVSRLILLCHTSK